MARQALTIINDQYDHYDIQIRWVSGDLFDKVGTSERI